MACLNDLIQQNSYAILTVLNIVDWLEDDGGAALMPAVRKLGIESKSVEKPGKTKVVVDYPGRMQLNLFERFGK